MYKYHLSIKTGFFLVLFVFSITTAFAQFAGGSGTQQDPYLIANAANLNNIRYYLGSCFKQIYDVDLNTDPYNIGEGWNPIGFYYDQYHPNNLPFSGTYDGNGFTIANLYINRSLNSYNGLFCLVQNATLTNIRLNNCNISGNVCGGFLVATAYYADINNCFVNGTISVDSYGGGLAGQVRFSNVSYCNSSGSVTTTNLGAGGLIGYTFHSAITRCYSNMAVSGRGVIGGLVASNNYSTINNCWSSSHVTGTLTTSGHAGGLIGGQTGSQCYNSYATGNVSADNNSGGFCGVMVNSTIANCYSTGHITGDQVGGFIFWFDISSIITNCYWDRRTSGLVYSGGGYARTTEEMTWPYSDNTYVNWDFDNIWINDITGTLHNGYPYLYEMPVTAVEDNALPEVQNASLKNFPNPFNSCATICFNLKTNSWVKLVIYNSKGQFVKTLTDEIFAKGEHEFIWDGKDEAGGQVSSGVYLVKMTGSDFKLARKLMLLK